MNTITHTAFDGVRVVWSKPTATQHLTQGQGITAATIRRSMDGVVLRGSLSHVSHRSDMQRLNTLVREDQKAPSVVARMREIVEGVITRPQNATPNVAWPYAG